jgi:hypothetical protein
MIPDKVFKQLKHFCEGYELYLKGGKIESGYKPDCVLKRNNDFIILESENSSSRKTFVGGLIKAAHYLQNDRTGTLVFIIVPKKNTKAITIANHLKPYYGWIKEKTNLKQLVVIEAKHYYNGSDTLKIGSNDFYKVAFTV